MISAALVLLVLGGLNGNIAFRMMGSIKWKGTITLRSGSKLQDISFISNYSKQIDQVASP